MTYEIEIGMVVAASVKVEAGSLEEAKEFAIRRAMEAAIIHPDITVFATDISVYGEI